jgi:putative oxidoreductase
MAQQVTNLHPTSSTIKIKDMKNSFKIPQLLLRIALGAGFLVTISDRLGLLGPFGNRNIEWGSWENFISYTNTLMPFLDKPAVNIMGAMATLAEAAIGILLIIGFKTRQVAIGSCILTLIFAISMTLFLGIKAPINFAVFPFCTASLLLATMPAYEWSIDQSFAATDK